LEDILTANAINNAGEIVGGGIFLNRIFDAYHWRNTVATDLGTLPGDCFSQAFAINSRGQVVGKSKACDSSTRSFLWEDGSTIDLNAFVPPGSGFATGGSTRDHDRCGGPRREVFFWILELLRGKGLVKGKTVGIDGTTLEANEVRWPSLERAQISTTLQWGFASYLTI
jgi:probable HAF family extracellular repeat protein